MNLRVGTRQGLDGIAVELDRMTEKEVEEVDPKRRPLLSAAHHLSGPRHRHVLCRTPPDPRTAPPRRGLPVSEDSPDPDLPPCPGYPFPGTSSRQLGGTLFLEDEVEGTSILLLSSSTPGFNPGQSHHIGTAHWYS